MCQKNADLITLVDSVVSEVDEELDKIHEICFENIYSFYEVTLIWNSFGNLVCVKRHNISEVGFACMYEPYCSVYIR
jgi:hypothetical protein